MADRKIYLITVQQQLAEEVLTSDIAWLENRLEQLGVSIAVYEEADVVWNRYSFLDTGGVKDKLLRLGIEVGNFNWPDIVDVSGYTSIDFENSKFAAKHILNVPAWVEFDV